MIRLDCFSQSFPVNRPIANKKRILLKQFQRKKWYKSASKYIYLILSHDLSLKLTLRKTLLAASQNRKY